MGSPQDDFEEMAGRLLTMISSIIQGSKDGGSVSSAAAASKLLEKKKEFEAVAALERASAQFVKRIEELGDDFDVMADAGIVHGQVLEQWPNMFRILNLFLSQREQQMDDENASAGTTGDRLVRVPIEELRQTAPKST